MTQEKTEPNTAVKQIDNDLVDVVAQYDQHFFPDDRTMFIKKWMLQPKTVGIAIVNYKKRTEVQGISLYRIKILGCRIFNSTLTN